MNQPTLFAESINDALGDAVRALGGAKVVGPLLRPDQSVLHASRWLLDCLNSDRREHLTPEQVLWLLRKAKEVGCHSAINYLCDEAGYTRPSPLSPEDEAAELQRRFIDAVRESKQIAERLDRINIKAVA